MKTDHSKSWAMNEYHAYLENEDGKQANVKQYKTERKTGNLGACVLCKMCHGSCLQHKKHKKSGL